MDTINKNNDNDNDNDSQHSGGDCENNSNSIHRGRRNEKTIIFYSFFCSKYPDYKFWVEFNDKEIKWRYGFGRQECDEELEHNESDTVIEFNGNSYLVRFFQDNEILKDVIIHKFIIYDLDLYCNNFHIHNLELEDSIIQLNGYDGTNLVLTFKKINYHHIQYFKSN